MFLHSFRWGLIVCPNRRPFPFSVQRCLKCLLTTILAPNSKTYEHVWDPLHAWQSLGPAQKARRMNADLKREVANQLIDSSSMPHPLRTFQAAARTVSFCSDTHRKCFNFHISAMVTLTKHAVYSTTINTSWSNLVCHPNIVCPKGWLSTSCLQDHLPFLDLVERYSVTSAAPERKSKAFKRRSSWLSRSTCRVSDRTRIKVGPVWWKTWHAWPAKCLATSCNGF